MTTVDSTLGPARAPGKIYELLAKVLGDVDAVAKDSKNEQQGYKFRSIDDVYNSVHAAFAKHGVFTLLTIMSRTDTVRQTKSGGQQYHCLCRFLIRFYATDGSCVDSVLDAEGLDTGDKGTNKAISFAHKYALLTALSIPTEDMTEGDRERTELKREEYDDRRPEPTPRPSAGAQANKPPAGKPPVAPNKAPAAPAEPPKAAAGPAEPWRISQKQRSMLWARLMKLDYDKDGAQEFMKAHGGHEHSDDWARADFERVLATIEQIEAKAPQISGTKEEDWNNV